MSKVLKIIILLGVLLCIGCKTNLKTQNMLYSLRGNEFSPEYDLGQLGMKFKLSEDIVVAKDSIGFKGVLLDYSTNYPIEFYSLYSCSKLNGKLRINDTIVRNKTGPIDLVLSKKSFPLFFFH